MANLKFEIAQRLAEKIKANPGVFSAEIVRAAKIFTRSAVAGVWESDPDFDRKGGSDSWARIAERLPEILEKLKSCP